MFSFKTKVNSNSFWYDIKQIYAYQNRPYNYYRLEDVLSHLVLNDSWIYVSIGLSFKIANVKFIL